MERSFKEELLRFQQEAQSEFENILAYWMHFTIDHANGGFYGKIDDDNIIYPESEKGSVLNGRILWTFSSAYLFSENKMYLDVARRAYDYIISYFIDREYGGVYWTVNANGEPADNKKHIYACAFILYGLSGYYRASRNEDVKTCAIGLYQTIVTYGFDKNNGGFFEAFSRDWNEINDQRLSDKDENEKKSMNTCLHVLEAFANLYLSWPDDELKTHIRDLLNIFCNKIIDPGSGHLKLFFDEKWNSKGNLISYGHDIEAAWLLHECASIIGDHSLIEIFEEKASSLAESAMEGLDEDGGLWYEYDHASKIITWEKHWWPQAEAMVGFFNAWQVTGDTKFFNASQKSWEFIKSHMINDSGEWYWGINGDGTVIQGHDKAGIWKCPYHNTRSCLEIVKRITSLQGSRYPPTSPPAAAASL